MSNRDGQFDGNGPPEERRDEPTDIGAALARHDKELRAYLLGLLRDRHAAEETLQTVYLKALSHRDTIQTHSIRPRLFRVAHNEGMNCHRRRRQESRATAKLAWWNERTEQQPDTNLLRQEQAARVRTAIGELPAAQRDVVQLRIFEDRTFAQIAAQLNLPLGTVLTRMRLASERLTRALWGEMEP